MKSGDWIVICVFLLVCAVITAINYESGEDVEAALLWGSLIKGLIIGGISSTVVWFVLNSITRKATWRSGAILFFLWVCGMIFCTRGAVKSQEGKGEPQQKTGSTAQATQRIC